MAGAPMVLTAAMIATATGGTVAAGDAETAISGFSIDSRTLQPGDLFFAIVAARDGHDFVEQALAKGACGAVVQTAGATGVLRAASGREPVVIQVPDTTLALQDLGRHVRRESGATVVAITGSAGKTTTKETIAAFLSGTYRVTKNKGNLNNHLGLPLSLLELRHGADVAVMELGMNHAGEISLLVGIAEPEVRVWTNVGDAHLGYFASREAVADAKAEILESARPADLLVANADDPLISARVSNFAGRTLRFGLSEDADVRAAGIVDRGLEGTRFTLQTPAGAIDVETPLVGGGNLSNVLAAAAVAVHFAVPLAEIANQARRLEPASHRGVVLRLPRGVTVIDDSYNSNPSALQRMLEVVAEDTAAGRKVAVLGEMLELGAHSPQLHEACGKAAAAAGLSRLVAVGGEAAQALAVGAVNAGMAADAVTWTASSAAAADLLLPWLRGGDLVLVKGSRGIRTEIVVERITEAFS
jgi:UDP-N-acetylmuramoyl-tripeptide--D-alanyl-D-alanine ligase